LAKIPGVFEKQKIMLDIYAIFGYLDQSTGNLDMDRDKEAGESPALPRNCKQLPKPQNATVIDLMGRRGE
jgi:hypothetical protein